MKKEELLLHLDVIGEASDLNTLLKLFKELIVEHKHFELTDAQAEFLDQAIKHSLRAPRTSYAYLVYMERECTKDTKRKIIQSHKAEVEAKLRTSISEAQILLLPLISKESRPKFKVLYLRLKADCHRYMAEASLGDSHKASLDQSKQAYLEGSTIAKARLKPTDLGRLQIALNYAALHYDRLGNPVEGRRIAKEAYDAGNNALHTLGDQEEKEEAEEALSRLKESAEEADDTDQ